MESTLKVVNLGAQTLTAGPDEIAVLDLTAAPYAHGIRGVLWVFQSMALTGDITLTVSGNTAADGTGTDTVLQTVTIATADTDFCLETAAELLGHFSDRDASNNFYKSLVLDADGTNTDTLDACYVVEPLQEQDGLTPSDTTTVS
jgi:hypothetical protein